MIRGAYTPSLRVQTAPFGRCCFFLFSLHISYFLNAWMICLGSFFRCKVVWVTFPVQPKGPKVSDGFPPSQDASSWVCSHCNGCLRTWHGVGILWIFWNPWIWKPAESPQGSAEEVLKPYHHTHTLKDGRLRGIIWYQTDFRYHSMRWCILYIWK